MKLFHSPASPYVRKVMITAWERGVQDKIKLLSSAASPVQRDASIVAINSTGKIPCAVTPSGAPLFDSRVICQFVDQLSTTGTSVYAGPDRFAILTLEALADSISDASLLCRYESVIRPKELYWADCTTVKWKKLTRV